MRFENKINVLPWNEMYKYAEIYYNYHHNLEIPQRFRTNNGYEYQENGKIKLGTWLATQRLKNTPESERGKLLAKIGMRFENIRYVLSWDEMYKYAKIYFNYHNHLRIPTKFRTNDGYTEDLSGKIRLGSWVSEQRIKLDPQSEKGILLDKIGMIWNVGKNKEKIRM